MLKKSAALASFGLFFLIYAQAGEAPLTTDKVYIGKPESANNEVTEEENAKTRALKVNAAKVRSLGASGEGARDGARAIKIREGVYCANSRAQFTVSGDDNLSGLARYRYRVDDGGWIDYVSPVSIAQNGMHYLKWESVDRVGNWENQQSIRIDIDNNPPVVSAVPLGRHGIHRGLLVARPGFRLKVSARDDLCGVRLIYADVDGTGWSEVKDGSIEFTQPGLHRVQLQADDILENRSASTVVEVQIDPRPPMVYIRAVPAPVRIDGALVCKSGTVVEIRAGDAESEVGQLEYRYAPDGEWIGNVAYDLSVNKRNDYYVEARATDIAGNTSNPSTSFTCKAVGRPPTTVIIPRDGKK
jgi:hypothetical protein